MVKKIVLALFVVFLATACSETVDNGKYTFISNRNVKFDGLHIGTKNRIRVVGKDVNHIILGIHTKPHITWENAMDDAFNQTKGDLLINTKIRYVRRGFIFYGHSYWEVEGDAIRTKGF